MMITPKAMKFIGYAVLIAFPFYIISRFAFRHLLTMQHMPSGHEIYTYNLGQIFLTGVFSLPFFLATGFFAIALSKYMENQNRDIPETFE